LVSEFVTLDVPVPPKTMFVDCVRGVV